MHLHAQLSAADAINLMYNTKSRTDIEGAQQTVAKK
jgi:hypothetical protein